MNESTAKKLLEKVKRDYAKIADDFDNTRKRGWKDFEVFDPYLKGKVLDIGCGNGRLKDYIGDRAEYFGCDNNEKFVTIAKKRGGGFEIGDFLDLPYPDNHFDLVVSVAAFHHIPSRKLRKKALKEVKRVMKPGATGIFLVWNLWQRKYIPIFLKSCLRSLLTFGKYSPQDFFVPWGNKASRYYYAFTKRSLKKLFKKVALTPSGKNFYVIFKK
ncbi:class I SAM-dependent methyltransferase [Patescibacteria group bacterium]|nr:class I SAM-dependent methyltransferase [Patescibacteria group bacterium]